MNMFLINVVMSLAWGAVTGSFAPLNLVFGFVLGALSLSLIREQTGSVSYFVRAWRVTTLAILFIYELVLSSVRVARLVLTPDMNLKPGIIAYPLKVQGDFEITLLANLITLTPGTLSVDVSDDRRTLYVHALDCSDPEDTRQSIADGFERKILEAFE